MEIIIWTAVFAYIVGYWRGMADRLNASKNHPNVESASWNG